MFHNIDKNILKRMQYLEGIDAADRIDGTPHLTRLRQIPPETGKFLALMASFAPPGLFIELGTSAGYSTLWLALACRKIGAKLVTFEILEEKAKLARQTFRRAGVEDVIEFIEGDARGYLDRYKNISFCFLDAEKDDYEEFYEMVIPKMLRGGILIADNVISHKKALEPMVDKALSDERVDALVIPIGKGELVCRKI